MEEYIRAEDKLTYDEVWETLNVQDLREFSEKKGNFTYLSWTDAWSVMMKCFPEVTYEFFPETYEPNKTVMSHCTVRIEGLERTMWLPVMDNRKNSIVNPTTRQIQDTRMRCLVKCLAMYGLGNYIFRGEDFPDEKKDISEKEAKTPVSETKEYLDGDNQTKSEKTQKVKHLWPERWEEDDQFPAWVENQFPEKLMTNLPKLKDWRDVLVEKNSTLAVARLDIILERKGIKL